MPWIRIIIPEFELKTLSLREKLTSEQLAAQQFRYPQKHEHVAKINFTTVSAFQLFTKGVPQHFFVDEDTNFGIVVNRSEADRKVMFRDHKYRCMVSDEIFKEALDEKTFRDRMRGNHFVETTEKGALTILKKHWKERLEDHEEEKKACLEEGNSEPEDPKLFWSEGVFRHQFSDIDAIFVKQNTESLRKGYAFARVVEEVTGKRMKFKTWDDDKAELVECDREKIKEVLGFRVDEANPSKKIPDKETSSEIRKYRSYLAEAQRSGR